MDSKLAVCLQLGLSGWFGFSCAISVGAHETSARASERSVTSANERTDALGANTEFQSWALHAQTTVVYQYHPAFHSPYQGPNSLTPEAQGKETFDLTLYGGVRLWRGAELWINPEIDQGFGLSNTLGV